jgi:glycosyltransferase involved in cell wall biosynthesis
MKPKLALLWHEAGNPLYHDRFRALSQNFELTVVGPKTFQGQHFDGKADGFTLLLFPAWLTGHWLTFISLPLWWFVLRRRDFEVLYVHEEPHSLMAFLLALAKGRRKLVLESSAINHKGNLRGFNFLEAFVYRRVDRIFPKNPEVGDVLVARGAARAKIGAPVGNGVDRNSFDVVPKAQARAELAARQPQFEKALQSDPLLVGYAGRIWVPKGLDLLAALGSRPGIERALCGEVFDPPLARELEDAGCILLPKLGMTDLRLFYSALDLFILPSLSTPGWREQFGRVCIEAIYCGTPAIGSAVGGIPMVIGADNTFPPGDFEAAFALVDGLRDPQARADLLARQTRHVEAHFSWSAIAGQVRDAVAELSAG